MWPRLDSDPVSCPPQAVGQASTASKIHSSHIWSCASHSTSSLRNGMQPGKGLGLRVVQMQHFTINAWWKLELHVKNTLKQVWSIPHGVSTILRTMITSKGQLGEPDFSGWWNISQSARGIQKQATPTHKKTHTNLWFKYMFFFVFLLVKDTQLVQYISLYLFDLVW